LRGEEREKKEPGDTTWNQGRKVKNTPHRGKINTKKSRKKNSREDFANLVVKK